MACVSPCLPPLWSLGISRDDAATLRRAAMTLRSWYESECGSDRGAIERDEATGRPYWRSATTGRRGPPVADREAGALRRAAAVMAQYPSLGHYIQSDPRGASLWILRPGDVPAGKDAEAYYSRGLPVYL